jgi:hypothetical protein
MEKKIDGFQKELMTISATRESRHACRIFRLSYRAKRGSGYLLDPEKTSYPRHFPSRTLCRIRSFRGDNLQHALL